MAKKRQKHAPGEDELIEMMKSTVGGHPQGIPVSIGDDTAVLRSPGKDSDLLFTTDMLVEGTHFRLEWSSPYQVGWKAIAASVSDIAAMGGRPVGAVISAGIRARKRESFCRHLYEGITAASERYGFPIVGGDTVKSDKVVINVAMVGSVAHGRALERKGAKPGDILLVTGTCGDSAAGFEILSKRGKNRLSRNEKILVQRHLVPEPSIDAGLAASASGSVTAMMDLSDGLAVDLPRLLGRSGAGASVRAEDIPVSDELDFYCRKTGTDYLDYAVSAGEDFNLLMAADPKKVDVLTELMAAAGVDITPIGKITRASQGLKLVLLEGSVMQWPEKGFSHF